MSVAQDIAARIQESESAIEVLTALRLTAGSVSAHEAAPDPHPGYMTSSEAAAAFDVLGAAAAAQAASQPLDADLTAIAEVSAY